MLVHGTQRRVCEELMLPNPFSQTVSGKCIFCGFATDNLFSSRYVCDNCVNEMVDAKLKMISYKCVRCGKSASIQYFPDDDKVCGTCTKQIAENAEKNKKCDSCDGTGKETYTSAKSGKEHVTICSECQGRGLVKHSDDV